MIKLITCDLDGTLLDDNKKIDSGIFELLPILKEKGIGFTVASGRNEELLDHYIDELNIDLPYITNNGGNIYKKHQCLENDFINNNYNNHILRLLAKNKIAFRAFSPIETYYYLDTAFFDSRNSKYVGNRFEYHEQLDFNEIDLFKITFDINDNISILDEISNDIKKHCSDINLLKAEDNVYCINSISANKGDSLIRLCKLIDINIDEVMVFGDNETDIPMLLKAGISVAPNNCDANIKQIVDYICDDNNHNGVSSFIKEHFKDILL